MTRPLLALWAGAALMLLGATAPAGPAAGPADVVQAFNAAISRRDLESALARFAKGSVQFTLKAAHAGTGPPAGLTTDLRTHWSTIGPVLLAMTTSYDRAAVPLDSRIDGDLATVWTRTTTTSTSLKGEKREESFAEVYVLVREGGEWRIGAIADTRGTDKLAVTGQR